MTRLVTCTPSEICSDALDCPSYSRGHWHPVLQWIVEAKAASASIVADGWTGGRAAGFKVYSPPALPFSVCCVRILGSSPHVQSSFGVKALPLHARSPPTGKLCFKPWKNRSFSVLSSYNPRVITPNAISFRNNFVGVVLSRNVPCLDFEIHLQFDQHNARKTRFNWYLVSMNIYNNWFVSACACFDDWQLNPLLGFVISFMFNWCITPSTCQALHTLSICVLSITI